MGYWHHALTVPAKVSKGPDSTKAKRGTTVVLKAEISGEPPPDVAWLKDGDDIEENDRWVHYYTMSIRKCCVRFIL